MMSAALATRRKHRAVLMSEAKKRLELSMRNMEASAENATPLGRFFRRAYLSFVLILTSFDSLLALVLLARTVGDESFAQMCLCSFRCDRQSARVFDHYTLNWNETFSECGGETWNCQVQSNCKSSA